MAEYQSTVTQATLTSVARGTSYPASAGAMKRPAANGVENGTQPGYIERSLVSAFAVAAGGLFHAADVVLSAFAAVCCFFGSLGRRHADLLGHLVRSTPTRCVPTDIFCMEASVCMFRPCGCLPRQPVGSPKLAFQLGLLPNWETE